MRSEWEKNLRTRGKMITHDNNTYPDPHIPNSTVLRNPQPYSYRTSSRSCCTLPCSVRARGRLSTLRDRPDLNDNN